MCMFIPDEYGVMSQTLSLLLPSPLSYLHFQVVSPIALAAGILSMQEQAIPPPLQPNSMSFIILVVILMGLISSVVGLMFNWNWIKCALGRVFKVAGPKFDNEDIELQEM